MVAINSSSVILFNKVVDQTSIALVYDLVSMKTLAKMTIDFSDKTQSYCSGISRVDKKMNL